MARRNFSLKVPQRKRLARRESLAHREQEAKIILLSLPKKRGRGGGAGGGGGGEGREEEGEEMRRRSSPRGPACSSKAPPSTGFKPPQTAPSTGHQVFKYIRAGRAFLTPTTTVVQVCDPRCWVPEAGEWELRASPGSVGKQELPWLDSGSCEQ